MFTTTKRIEDINTNLLEFKMPKKLDGFKFFNLFYEGKNIVIQLPKLPVIFGGISEFQAKDAGEITYSLNLGLSENPSLFAKLEQIDEIYKDFLCNNWSVLKGKKTNITREMLDNTEIFDLIKYTKKDTAKEKPFLTCKLKMNNENEFDFENVFVLNEYNEIQEENVILTPENVGDYISNNTDIASIMNIYGWQSAAQGITIKPKMLRIWNASSGSNGFVDSEVEDECTVGEVEQECVVEDECAVSEVEQPLESPKKGRKKKEV